MRTESIPKFTSGHWNPNLHKYGVLLTPWNNAVRSTESILFSNAKKSAKNSWKQFLPKNLYKTCLDFTDYRLSSIYPALFFRILNSLCTQVTHTLRKCKMPAVCNCLNDDGGPLWWVAGDPWLLGIPRDNFCVGGKKQRRRLKIWITVYTFRWK